MSIMGTTTLMSLQEFERLDSPEKLELLKGELIQVSLPKRRHGEICKRIFKPLDAAFERCRAAGPESRLGEVYLEMGYLLSGEPPILLGPDVSITHPNQPGEEWYLGAPLVAFEVVSDNDRAARLDEKVAEYLAHGAQEVWVIYPIKRHAWVYRQGTDRPEAHTIRSHR